MLPTSPRARLVAVGALVVPSVVFYYLFYSDFKQEFPLPHVSMTRSSPPHAEVAPERPLLAGRPAAEDEARSQELPPLVLAADLEGYAQAYLDELIGRHSQEGDDVVYGLQLGDTSLAGYAAELRDIYDTYFAPLAGDAAAAPAGRLRATLDLALARLALKAPARPLPPRPKQVMTTDRNPSALPKEFALWRKLMPDWAVRCFDDDGLHAWVDRVLGGTRAAAVWGRLPRRVLQTDTFRYMAMLFEGGVYTDSDTGPIIPIKAWGRPYDDLTPPLLTHLARLLSIVDDPTSTPANTTARGREAYERPPVDDGAEAGEPGLIISVESDLANFEFNTWRDWGMASAIQMTQWTFAARPGHPVFVDAVGRALRNSEQMEARAREAEEKGEAFIPDSAIEWTGPGVFVYRYLVARYGFMPEEIVHQKNPIRVGDVLILPSFSFSAHDPWLHVKQRDEWAAVYHGHQGRWRNEDPATVEAERLRKLKAEGKLQ